MITLIYSSVTVVLILFTVIIVLLVRVNTLSHDIAKEKLCNEALMDLIGFPESEEVFKARWNLDESVEQSNQAK